jgi:putative drug exporter of the RND superfamily
MSWHRLTGIPSGRRTKFVALVLWLVLASVAAPLGAKLTEVLNNDTLSALPSSAETARALVRAEAAFPGSDRLVAVAVYARDSGLTGADRAKADADRAAFARFAQNAAVPPAIASEDGKALLLSFPLAGSDEQQSDAATESSSGSPPVPQPARRPR